MAGTTIGLASARRYRPPVSRQQGLAYLDATYMLFFALGCLSPAAAYYEARGYTGAVSFEELSLFIAKASYMGDFVEPPLTRFFRLPLYLTALLGGLLLPLHGRGKPRWRWFLWMLPLAVSAMINTRRGGLLYGAVMFGAGYLAGRAFVRAPDVPLRRLLLIGGIGGGLVAAVFVLLQALRMGRVELEQLGFISDHLRSYYNPHMAVLGTWLNDPASTADAGLGIHTFAGIADSLGLRERETGLYQSVVDFGDERSNIYTGIRPLVEDFGWFGMVVFASVLGALGGTGWARLERGDLMGAPLLCAYIVFVLWSPITSIFVYNTILTGLILLYPVLWSLGRFRR